MEEEEGISDAGLNQTVVNSGNYTERAEPRKIGSGEDMVFLLDSRVARASEEAESLIIWVRRRIFEAQRGRGEDLSDRLGFEVEAVLA